MINPQPFNPNLLQHAKNISASACADYFSAVINGLQEMLEDQKPRLVILLDDKDNNCKEIQQSLNSELLEWNIKTITPAKTFSKDLYFFADHGILLTRATQPFRDDEVAILNRNWRLGFSWDVLVACADNLTDETEYEDLCDCSKNVFFSASDGHKRVNNVWKCVDEIIKVYRSNNPVNSRNQYYLEILHNAVFELKYNLSNETHELTSIIEELELKINNEKDNINGLYQSLVELKQKLQKELNSLQNDILDFTRKELSSSEAEVLGLVNVYAIDDIRKRVKELMEAIPSTISQRISVRMETLTNMASEELKAIRARFDLHLINLTNEDEITPINNHSPENNLDINSQRINITDALRSILIGAGISSVAAGILGSFFAGPLGLGASVISLVDSCNRTRRSRIESLKINIMRVFSEFSESINNDIISQLPNKSNELISKCNLVFDDTYRTIAARFLSLPEQDDRIKAKSRVNHNELIINHLNELTLLIQHEEIMERRRF